jgi:ElaB/YqjD/DUF883 family membrane-anchored ribosome-binding protein
LSKKNDITLKEFVQRKNRIEAELNQIQNNLDNSVTRVRDSVLHSVLPADKIRKKPFKSVGIAVLIGFVIGLPKLKGKKKSKEGGGSTHGLGVTSLMADEIKRLAAQKVAGYIMDMVDAKFSERFKSDGSNKENNTNQ